MGRVGNQRTTVVLGNEFGSGPGKKGKEVQLRLPVSSSDYQQTETQRVNEPVLGYHNIDTEEEVFNYPRESTAEK